MRILRAVAGLIVALLIAGQVSATIAGADPIPAPPGYGGKITEFARDAQPWWPPEVTAPANAPNVLLWFIDDAGFASTETFGGLIDTPNIDRVAKTGLIYTNFHATPICSSSRTSLLTGRNPHAAGMGGHAAAAAGFPGYYGRVKKSAGSLAKILKANGYTTYATGKWDQLPSQAASIAGPFDQWPSGQGFDHFYGFLAAETHNFRPAMWSDHAPVMPYVGDPDYHLSADMADKAVSWITGQSSVSPRRPFFLYWATGAVHSPHHAPKEYIDKYHGRFDMGWDKLRETVLARQKTRGIVPGYTKLPPRPAELRAWDSLSADEKRIAAREMEVYAAQLDHADHEFGRILDTLERTGQLQNTIVIVTADNGASSEGGPEGNFNDARQFIGESGTFADNLAHIDAWGGPKESSHYSAAWALAVNTPFNYYKQMTYGGGVRVPMVISWPRTVPPTAEKRPQFYHLNDIAPTVLDLAGITPPQEMDGVAQQPIDGVSMAATFESAGKASNKHVQYFEMVGNRGVYADGWKAIAVVSRKPWVTWEDGDASKATWELYDLGRDINERFNVADKYPQKLREMIALFDAEARRNNVYPLRPSVRHGFELNEKRIKDQDGAFIFYTPGATQLPYAVTAPIYGKSFDITASVADGRDAEGVIFAQGGVSGGFALYVDGGHPVFAHNNMGNAIHRLKSDAPLPPGTTTVRVVYDQKLDGSAAVTMYVGTGQVGQGTFPDAQKYTVGFDETFDLGQDSGSGVIPDYTAPFPFTGSLEKVTIQINP